MPFASSNTYVANTDLKVGPVKAFSKNEIVLGTNAYAAEWYALGQLDLDEELEDANDTVIVYSGDKIASITENGITTYYTYYPGTNDIYTEVTEGVTRTHEYSGGNLVRISVTP